MAWHKGKKLDGGNYIIGGELGGGGFATVYRARTRSRKLVAIKKLKDEIQRSPLFTKFLTDFTNEALLLEKCKHPHVVKVEKIIYDGRLPCVVMEYIEGESLDDLLQRRSLSEAEAIHYIQQVGEALILVHKQGLLHRDIKPKNIMLRRSTSDAVLIDFGIARTFISNLTQTHTEILTGGFAPIEQYFPRAKRGAYTDIYALAATLYNLLTKQVPIDAPTRADYRRTYGNDPLKSPQSYVNSISDRVNNAVLKGMAIEANQRPQSVREWLDLLIEPGTPNSNSPSGSNTPVVPTTVKETQPPKADIRLPLQVLFGLALSSIPLSFTGWQIWSHLTAPPSIESFVVIQPKYTSASDFSEGLASVRVGDKYGYIDKSGKFIIQPKFTDSSSFSDGLASASLDNKKGYIDKNGNFVVQPQFVYASSFSEELAPFGGCVSGSCVSGLVLEAFRGKQGYIDKSGKVTIGAIFDIASNFSEGLAAVKHDITWKKEEARPEFNKWGYIDKNGNYIVQPKFDHALSFFNGLAAVNIGGTGNLLGVSGGKWGYINKKGIFVVQPKFDEALSFSSGLAAVKVGDKWGYIDKTGNIIIQPRFDSANYFIGALAAVKVGNKWGYIDKNGNLAIQPEFDMAANFSEGLALVLNGDKCGYIDKNGRVVAQSSARKTNSGSNCYDYSSFSEGFAAVKIGEKSGYIRNPLSNQDS